MSSPHVELVVVSSLCLSTVGSCFLFYISVFGVCTFSPCWLSVHCLVPTLLQAQRVYAHTHKHTLTVAQGFDSQAWNQALNVSRLVCYCAIGAAGGRQLDGFPLEPPWRQSLVCRVFFPLAFCKENKVNMTHSRSIFRLVFWKCVSHTLNACIVHLRRSLHTVLKTMSNSPQWRPVCDLYFSSSSPVEQHCIII